MVDETKQYYWYELLIRGYQGSSTVPWQSDNPGINWQPSRINSRGRDYGAVCYAFPLSPEEIDYYDLKFIGKANFFNKVG